MPGAGGRRTEALFLRAETQHFERTAFPSPHRICFKGRIWPLEPCFSQNIGFEKHCFFPIKWFWNIWKAIVWKLWSYSRFRSISCLETLKWTNIKGFVCASMQVLSSHLIWNGETAEKARISCIIGWNAVFSGLLRWNTADGPSEDKEKKKDWRLWKKQFG